MWPFRKRKRIENPELIARLKSRAIKYVSTRDENGTEIILGHSGTISIKDDELIVFSEGRDVFRCSVYEVEAGELLSKDGVRLKHTDENGNVNAVTAYYVFRR